MADVVVVNKLDTADTHAVSQVVANVAAANPTATLIRAASPVTLAPGPSIAGRRVLVVEDGPTLTHGGMPFGAGTVAARHAGAGTLVDPRPYAVGSIAEAFSRYPQMGALVPAMGYDSKQIAELEATIAATPCDVVVTGTPIDLRRIINVDKPVRHATYELREIGSPTLGDVLVSVIERARSEQR
jgi:predicted GTPase